MPLVKNAKARKVDPDAKIYGSNDEFPSKPYEIVSVQKKRGVTILHVNIRPVVYRPKSGEVTAFTGITLTVKTKPESKTGSGAKIRLRSIPGSVKTGVENPEALNTYSDTAYENIQQPEGSLNSGNPSPLGITDPADSYKYVIVTSAALRDAVADYTVRELLSHKQSRGLTATIVTIEDIYAGYTGIDNAQKLRNFIIEAYNNWETEYVLLAGDVSIIPIRYLYDDGATIPSDLYYQCLDGTYNNDGDTYWGEPNDGVGGGDVDLMAEVYVGRASAENATEMSNFVFKTITYENQPDQTYLHRALIAGEYLGTNFGSGEFAYARPYMEEIRFGASTSGYTSAGFSSCPSITVDTLYDYNGTWPK
jgi:hypothetical protein